MESYEILSLTNLLEEFKNKTDRCLENNEYSRNLISKICSSKREENQPCFCYALEDFEEYPKISEGIRCFKLSEELESLETILQKKLQENATLKMLNERLTMNCQQKSQKIKDLTRTISQHSQHSEKAKFKEISSYKDKVGRYNVEIQKLKKELSLENKKLQNEKAKVSKLAKNDKLNQNALPVGKRISSAVGDKLIKSDKQKQRKVMSDLFKELDEIHVRETLKLIEENKDEASLLDETLDLSDFCSETDEEIEAFNKFNEASERCCEMPERCSEAEASEKYSESEASICSEASQRCSEVTQRCSDAEDECLS